MTFERGIFKWVSADGAPNQSWSMRGTLTVTLLDGFVMVQNLSDEKIVVPSHRVIHSSVDAVIYCSHVLTRRVVTHRSVVHLSMPHGCMVHAAMVYSPVIQIGHPIACGCGLMVRPYRLGF